MRSNLDSHRVSRTLAVIGTANKRDRWRHVSAVRRPPANQSRAALLVTWPLRFCQFVQLLCNAVSSSPDSGFSGPKFAINRKYPLFSTMHKLPRNGCRWTCVVCANVGWGERRRESSWRLSSPFSRVPSSYYCPCCPVVCGVPRLSRPRLSPGPGLILGLSISM